MMAAQKAWLVAGALSLQGLAFAGEGTSLRGLKIPPAASESPVYTLSGTEARLKRNGDAALPDFGARLFLSGGTSQSRRLTINDMDYRFSLHQPNGAYASALAEPGAASLIDTVPRYTLSTRVTQMLPGGWGLGFGVRQTEYNFASANLVSFSAERALGSFRGAYTLSSSRVEGTGLGSAHRFEVNYLYGERNSVGLSYTTGRDIDNVAVPTTLSLADVKDWSLSGRHWLSPNWALTYDVLSQEQVLYRRQGLRLGVSRSF